MKKKGKRMKNAGGRNPIARMPEEVIQHIQSFMSADEAARSTVVSKAWYGAWLTRPTIDLDDGYFGRDAGDMFEEYSKRTMQRYQDSSLNIRSFSLRLFPARCLYWAAMSRLCHDLIASAIKMGATHLELTWLGPVCLLPQEVLASQTLVKLSLDGFRLDKSCFINCLMLKSLTLTLTQPHVYVDLGYNDVLKDLTSRCISLEELSLSHCDCDCFVLRRTNVNELPKLWRLFLKGINVDDTFFTDFASRFPRLKDLTIDCCIGYTRLHIAATSLQTVTFKLREIGSASNKFDIPNIRKFSYSGYDLPSNLCINGASSWEWELDIVIFCNGFPKTSRFMNLKKLLNNFTLSRISLSLDVYDRITESEHEHEVDVEVVPNPLVVENLAIAATPTFCCALLLRSFGAFRPKFLTLHDPRTGYYPGKLHEDKAVDIFRNRVIKALVVSNWKEKFGQFGLKEVNVEILDELDTEWRPLQLLKALTASKAEVRLQLVWED